MKHELKTMHLFAGAGGGILADLILGHRPIVAVEWDSYACSVLRARVDDGWFDGMHVWEGDVRMFDPSDYKGRVDCIHAGFPCQDISVAGAKRGVGEGTRSGLYREVLRIADEIRPQYIFLENVAGIVAGDDGRMLRTVTGDLADRGYDAVWTCLSAAQVGAPHKRDRWWLLASYPDSESESDGSINDRKIAMGDSDNNGSSAAKVRKGSQEGDGDNPSREKQASQSQRSSQQHEDVADPRLKSERSESSRSNSEWIDSETQGIGSKTRNGSSDSGETLAYSSCSRGEAWIPESKQWEEGVSEISDNGSDRRCWRTRSSFWAVESNVGRVADGVASRSHRLKALGNGQVSLQAAAAFAILWKIKNP
jgi:DNA (cytosine-5)-methyltransferase 1